MKILLIIALVLGVIAMQKSSASLGGGEPSFCYHFGIDLDTGLAGPATFFGIAMSNGYCPGLPGVHDDDESNSLKHSTAECNTFLVPPHTN